MTINGVTFGAELIDILVELRKQLALRGINRFAKMFDSGDDIMVCCPYHKDGQERRPSAGIRKSDGQFHCLACGETKSLCEMISDCLGYNDPFGKEGYKWLTRNFLSLQIGERPKIDTSDWFDRCINGSDFVNNVVKEIANKIKESSYVTEEELDTYRYNHPYMYKRGLTDDIIELFDIGYDKATDSITFPVRDMNGDCMFVARRSVKTKRFDIPKGIIKPMYGLYELMHTQGFGVKYPMKLYLCEGLFDALRFWCNGKVALAGFGCLYNSYQIKQIQDLPIRTVVLALDNDKAGWESNARLRKLLTNKLVKEVVLPKGRHDIGECTDEEILNLEEVL